LVGYPAATEWRLRRESLASGAQPPAAGQRAGDLQAAGCERKRQRRVRLVAGQFPDEARRLSRWMERIAAGRHAGRETAIRVSRRTSPYGVQFARDQAEQRGLADRWRGSNRSARHVEYSGRQTTIFQRTSHS